MIKIIRIYSNFIIVIFQLYFIQFTTAQTLPDFMNLNDTGTVCNYGNTTNPLVYTGIVFNRHTVITQTGTDPNTGFQLPFLPAGEDTVIRLGNSQIGAQAEAITYRFTVNSDFSVLSLKFAVVFQDPGHPHSAQPRFVIRVINSLGQLVEECAQYDVSAGSGISGFNTFSSYGTPVRWRPWTNLGIDLSQYIDQEIRVQFITYDCEETGHYGYAYYTAHCVSNKINLIGCDGDIVTLTAPNGFSTYLWSNGSDTSSTTYQVSNGTISAYCNITSVTGCQFTLNAYITSQVNLPSNDSVYYATICQGESYQQNFFNIPPQAEPGNFVYMNSYYDLTNCTGDVTSILHLTVRQKYYNIIASACVGTNYTDFGFQLNNLPPGILYDTLFLNGSSGCDSILCLQLTVNPSFQLPNLIIGNTTPCQGTMETYSMQGATGLTNYIWNVPNGYSVISGQGTPSINLYIGNSATQGILVLEGFNGCGSGSIPLTITPKPSYHQFYTDTICTGNDYEQFGFHLPVQSSQGYYTFHQNFQTISGCDSVITLALIVASTPTLSILAQSEVICNDDTIQLDAVGSGYSIVSNPPAVAIGDILCIDGSIVKPAIWPVPGKVAQGVVFYVDNTGLHGWAVNLDDQAIGMVWSTLYVDIITLPNFTTPQTAIMDFDGYNNTQKIRAIGSAPIYPAAWAVDFANGWYLPAAGQLRKLYGVIPWLNVSLQVVGGTMFITHLNNDGNTYWWYWSSTEYSDYYAWAVDAMGNITNTTIGKGNYGTWVRSIRSF